MADPHVAPGVPGILKREADARNPLTVPLTPDEMWRQAVQSKRGFESSPSGAADAARRSIPTLPKDALESSQRGVNVGKGFETFSSIQVLDKDGRRVAIGAEWFGAGGLDDHAEAKTMRALDKSVDKVDGGKVLVVVDQAPCEHCAPKLKEWAQKIGASDVEVYVPERESLRQAGKMVTPKTAAVTSFKDLPKTTKLKQLWTHKVPRGPKLPPTPHGSRTARSAIKASLVGMLVAYALGFAQDALAADMKSNLQALPKPKLDPRGAAEFFGDPKTGKSIRFLDLLNKEIKPFGESLAKHHVQVIGSSNAELMLLAVSSIAATERVAFLDGLGDELDRYVRELYIIDGNLNTALDLQNACFENADAAEALAKLVDRALVADQLLKNGFTFDDIVDIYTNLKSYASTVRSTFANIRSVQSDVKRFIDEMNTLAHGVNKLRWHIVGDFMMEELKRSGIKPD